MNPELLVVNDVNNGLKSDCDVVPIVPIAVSKELKAWVNALLNISVCEGITPMVVPIPVVPRPVVPVPLPIPVEPNPVIPVVPDPMTPFPDWLSMPATPVNVVPSELNPV